MWIIYWMTYHVWTSQRLLLHPPNQTASHRLPTTISTSQPPVMGPCPKPAYPPTPQPPPPPPHPTTTIQPERRTAPPSPPPAGKPIRGCRGVPRGRGSGSTNQRPRGGMVRPIRGRRSVTWCRSQPMRSRRSVTWCRSQPMTSRRLVTWCRSQPMRSRHCCHVTCDWTKETKSEYSTNRNPTSLSRDQSNGQIKRGRFHVTPKCALIWLNYNVCLLIWKKYD